MIDKEQISIMIRDIEGYLSDLGAMDISSKEDFEEKETYYAVSMIIFQIMNRTIDIGNEVISGSSDILLPGSYKEAFEILSEKKVLSPKTASKMTNLMKYRNAIAHEYYRITADEIYRLKNDVYEVEDFVEEIKKYVARKT